jgi:pyridoxal phosphate phosphatase PHOSPHO2
MAPTPGSGGVLVVFDFDESLVEVNAVVDVARALFPEVHGRLESAWTSGQVTWPGLVNLFHELLAAERPEITIAQVHKAAARVPVHPQMLKAVRAAAGEHGATVKVVSDSTTFYINAMVEHHALGDCTTQVVANPMDEHPEVPNRLYMRPFHGPPDAPHECPHCPANMCKGSCEGGWRSFNCN